MLRIRADGTVEAPRNLDTTKIEEKCTHDTETARCEAWLKHVPDIQNFPAFVDFDWKSRSLVIGKIDGLDMPKSLKGWWCMYKCNKAWNGLPGGKNAFFKKDEGARAFGDVFIFRLENKKPDQSGRARFDTALSVPKGEVARKIFISLAKQWKDHVTGKSSPKQEAATARDEPKKRITILGKDPILGYLTISGQPNLSPMSMVEALRLHCDGSRVCMTYIPITEVGRDDKSLKKWLPMEKWLGHFPKMSALTHPSTFSWDHRQLLAMPADRLGGSFETKFLLYVCYEKKAKLTRNKYLEKLSGVHMYGDSFLFKVHCFKDYGRPDFLHMQEEDLVEGLEDGGATEQVLRKLLADLLEPENDVGGRSQRR